MCLQQAPDSSGRQKTSVRQTPGDRLLPEQLGAESAVVGESIGPYDGLPEAWSDLMATPNIAAGTPTMPCWEEYVTGPESGSGPADWRTTLVQPLA